MFKDPIVIIFEFLLPMKERAIISSELLQDLLELSGPGGRVVRWLEFLDTGVLSMGNWYAVKFLGNSSHLFGNSC